MFQRVRWAPPRKHLIRINRQVFPRGEEEASKLREGVKNVDKVDSVQRKAARMGRVL